MLNGLAGLLGMAMGRVMNEQNDSTYEQTPVRETGLNDDGDFADDEWVLLSDELSECGSLCSTDELELLVPLSSRASSPRSTVDSLGWKLAPPACFAPPRGQNKYKHVKHRNPNLLRSLAPGTKSSAAMMMEQSVLANLLIEQPAVPPTRRPLVARQRSGEPKADKVVVEPTQAVDERENQVPIRVVESKSAPAYVVTGIVAPQPVAQPTTTMTRLTISTSAQPEPQPHPFGKRRPKRQHFTLYDAAVFGAGAGNRGKRATNNAAR